MGEEKQFGVVNGRAETEASNPAKIHGWTKSDFTSNGNLVSPCFVKMSRFLTNEQIRVLALVIQSPLQWGSEYRT